MAKSRMAYSDPQTPKVSVVVAAWNAADFVAAAVRSALAQDGVAMEVVVVDDGSRDATAAIVTSIGDSRCRCIRLEKNEGPGAARNRGFDVARGDWVAVLDADDQFVPGRIERMLRIAEEASADVVVDDLIQVSEDGEELGPLFSERLSPSDELELSQFILSNAAFFSAQPSFGYMKPLFRKRFLQENGLAYDRALRIGEDYYLLADCLAAGAVVRIDHHPGYRYLRRRGSTSHRLQLDHLLRLQAADEAFVRRWRLDKTAETAAQQRGRAITAAVEFTLAVDAIKQRRWSAASAALLRRPSAALLFRHPIQARISRFAEAWL